MSERQKAYYKKYYQEHKEYFKARNSTDEKKQYYKEYYQKNKHLMKFKKRHVPIVKTIIKQITDKIIVRFD
jgi:hypothetical protein